MSWMSEPRSVAWRGIFGVRSRLITALWRDCDREMESEAEGK
jgi:hypothetical protein